MLAAVLEDNRHMTIGDRRRRRAPPGPRQSGTRPWITASSSGSPRQRRATRATSLSKTAAAAAVGVTPRTLNNWDKTPSFRRELESQRTRAEQRARPRPGGARRRGPRKRDPNREFAQPEPETPEVGPPTEQRQSAAVDSFAAIEARRLDSYENYLDSNQARRGQLTPAETRALDTDTNENQPNRKQRGRLGPSIHL